MKVINNRSSVNVMVFQAVLLCSLVGTSENIPCAMLKIWASSWLVSLRVPSSVNTPLFDSFNLCFIPNLPLTDRHIYEVHFSETRSKTLAFKRLMHCLPKP